MSTIRMTGALVLMLLLGACGSSSKPVIESSAGDAGPSGASDGGSGGVPSPSVDGGTTGSVDGGGGTGGTAAGTPDGGTVSCLPITCAAAGKNCGAIPDGCSGVLQCGSCAVGQTCGGGGTTNVCAGSPTVTSGQTRWVYSLSTSGADVIDGVGSDSSGNVLALMYGAAYQTFWLYRLSALGYTVLNSFPSSGSGQTRTSMLVGSDGAGYVSATSFGPGGAPTIDFGAGPLAGGQVAKLSSDGSFIRLIDSCGPQCDAIVLAADGNGNEVLYTISATHASVDIVHSDNSRANLYFASQNEGPSGPLATMGCGTAAFSPDGHVICGGLSLGGGPVLPADPSAANFSGAPIVAKLDVAGHVVWTLEIPVVGLITSIGTSAIGTVVATGLFRGAATFGNDRLTHESAGYGGYLVTIEADGTPRWARQFDLPVISLAVDPPGRAAVISASPSLGSYPFGGSFGGSIAPANEGSALVVYYDLAGAQHWFRTLPPRSSNIAIRDHDVVVGGVFAGTFDFGTLPLTSTNGGDDGFVIDLASGF